MNLLSSWLVGALAAALGLLGLVLASRAHDGAVELFGMVLFLFSVLFAFGLIRRAYDAREQAEAEAQSQADTRAAA
jgi:hypothetical protein